jgi:uncharacterized Tic20 family protein
MFKIAAIVWIMLSVVLAGIVLLVIVTVPSLAAQAQFLIPVACSAALVLAMPLSYLVARSISASRAG